MGEPLAGLRVIEIGQYIAAPFAATLLADHGADVVKVERPGGDPYRRDPARFAAWNRHKTSVTLDLRTADGVTELRRLIGDVDVVIENLRSGALERLGVSLTACRDATPRLVTCSITGYGSSGPARDDPGWEPLVHARAGAQQGMFTSDQPMWLPFPVASVAAALFAVLGVGAALVKRETTGYGQHVETSLFEAALFLNGGPIFHRPHRRLSVLPPVRTPVVHTYPTRDDRAIQVNLSGTERWRELCRLVELDGDGGLDFADPRSLAKLADRAWLDEMLGELTRRFAARTADEWEQALLAEPAAAAKCNTLEEWLDHEHARANGVFTDVEDAELGPVRLVAPPIRVTTTDEAQGRRRRHGSEGGALAGHRVVDLSTFWAGPLCARLLAELGADVVKVEPPGGEGGYQLMPVLPNIYVDGNRSKLGLVLDAREPEDRERLLDLVAAADVVVENAVPGKWERFDLGEDVLRKANPELVYARAKGFGMCGPMVSRPCFDYVMQAATGMVMTQGGGHAQPMNFTANDYCTGIHLAAGVVIALLGRARGTPVTSVEASLMMSATVFQSEHVAEIAAHGHRSDPVGPDLRGPEAGQRLYEAADGWIALHATTPSQLAALAAAFEVSDPEIDDVARAVARLSVDDALRRLDAHGVPAARSVHPSAVPDDPQVRDQALLTTVRHPVAGSFVQVGVPLQLSVDASAVKGPAPAPGGRMLPPRRS